MSIYAGSNYTAMIGERLAELLAMRAVAGLPPEESRELEDLLVQYPEVDVQGFDWFAASGPPAALRERLLQRASQESARRPWPARVWSAVARRLASTMKGE